MKKMLILFAATIFVSVIATAGIAVTNGPPEVKFTPKMGTVTFDHAAHQGTTECTTCHHTAEYAQCKSCHGADPGAPKAKDAFHKLCKDCHKEQNKGPTKCADCHIK